MNDRPAIPSKAPSTVPARTILLFGGYGAAQISCLRSWRDAGIGVVFVHITDGPKLPLLGPLLVAYHRISSADLQLTGAEAIRSLVRRHDCAAAVAVAAGQVSFLRSALSDTNCVVCAPSPSCIAMLETKLPQLELALEAGLSAARTWTIRREDDIVHIPETAFPIVLRPDSPDSAEPAFKAEFIASKFDLAKFFAGQTVGPSTRLVAQPFVLGPNLVVHGARAADGSVLHMAAFVADYKFEGVSQRLVPTVIDEPLRRACVRFVEAAGVYGVFHFDFILEGPARTPRFLEVNARLGGTTNKVLAIGYREPLYLLECFGIIPRNEATTKVRSRVVGNALSIVKRALSIWRGSQTPVDYPTLARWSSVPRLAVALLGSKDEILSLRHWRTAAAFYVQVLRDRGQ